MRIGGEFRPQNSLKSTQLPKFSNSLQKTSKTTRSSLDFLSQPVLKSSIFELADLLGSLSQAASPAVSEEYQAFTSSIDNSGSLFDAHLEAHLGSDGRASITIPEDSIYSANVRSAEITKGECLDTANMVNERSPAKAASQSTGANSQTTQQTNSAYVGHMAQASSTPIFGESTLPQSPLNRATLDRATVDSKLFLKSKPPQPEFQRVPHNTNHSHLHAAQGFVKGVVDPLRPKSTSTSYDPQYGALRPAAVPIPRPGDGITYATTQPVQPKTFGSMGNTYGGFKSVNHVQATNFIDLTAAGYRDRMAPPEPYTFVDPSKAAADLKALLEGAIEDEDDMPTTRLRKRKILEKADGLAAKLQGLAVTDGAQADEGDEDEDEDDGTVEGIKVKLLPHQVEGLSWMRDRELGTRKKGTVPKGGILADDMGLGKTLQSIALILTNPKPKGSDLEDGKRKFPSNMEKCTLVVAPLALIRQWEQELKEKVEDSHRLRVYVHHGPQRTKRFEDLKKYEVVITTYQILVSEHGSSSPDVDGLKVGCFGLHWYRVILDEAHTIKNRNAKATQACYALRSHYRWCLTGTPMQNNLDELQSLINFLRIKPYDDLKEWKDQIDRPMKNGRGDIAIKRLQHYLKIFMKRRTKEILKKEGALNPGGKISAVGEANTTGFRVTERRIEKVFAEFNARERLFYDRLEQRADKSLEEMLHGEKVNYANALVLLLRLRQACNHPKLVSGKLAKDGEALEVEQPRKAKAATIDVDEMADMFSGLGVGSKKCDVCGMTLSKELSRSGAVRCEDCEADLKLVAGNKIKTKSHEHQKSEVVTTRKPRNRPVILDSDEEEDGEWIIAEGERRLTSLGKAGGTDDENAEGEGISIGDEDSDDSEDVNHTQDIDVRYLSTKIKGEKEVITIDDSADDSQSNTDSEVEAEIESSSEEEAQLATIIASTKITHLLKILGKEAAQHKFIVFSQFTSMLDLIEPFLKRDGYKYTRYDGSMKNDLREASLSRLRNDKSCRVLLCSLKCGSLGLNLTAATRVVILEPFWNPFVEEQAIDRVHRLTQKTDVVVYKITIENSVEERILELQEKKRELANQAIEGGAKANVGKLGMKELLQLFRRDAEYALPTSSAETYTIGAKPSVLRGPLPGSGNASGLSSREGSVVMTGERRATPPISRPTQKEDQIYGRRW